MFSDRCTIPTRRYFCQAKADAIHEVLALVLQKSVQFVRIFFRIVKQFFCLYCHQRQDVDPILRYDTTIQVGGLDTSLQEGVVQDRPVPYNPSKVCPSPKDQA